MNLRVGKFLLLVLSVLILASSIYSVLPKDTNLDNMWVSENATDFWFINNPDEGLKNERSVFHYDSNLDLVSKFTPENLSRDEIEVTGFSATENDKWVVTGPNEVLMFSSNWELEESSRIIEEDDEVDKMIRGLVNRNGLKIITTEGTHDQELFMYDLNLDSLSAENKTSAETINVRDYPPKSNQIIHPLWSYIELNKSRDRLSRREITVKDIHKTNSNIWLLGKSTGYLSENKKPGQRAKVKIYEQDDNLFKFDLDMDYQNQSHSVGFNESLIKEVPHRNFIWVLMVGSALFAIVLAALLIILLVYLHYWSD